MTELGLISLKELLRVFTVSSDIWWCTGALLDLASDSCVKVKVVAVSPPDRDPGDVWGRISMMTTPLAEPSSLSLLVAKISGVSGLILVRVRVDYLVF